MGSGQAGTKKRLSQKDREWLLAIASELAPGHAGVSKNFAKRVSKRTRVPIREVEEVLGLSEDLPFQATACE